MSVPESTFTKPHAECPHPEWWSADDDESAEVEVVELVGALVRVLQPEYVVETGTFVGRMAQGIGQALLLNGHGRLDTVEIDGARVEQAVARCAGLPVSVHQMSSVDFEPAGEIGFAWFDSLLQLRCPEFLAYRPFMTKATIVGFHDTGPQFGNGFRSALSSLAAKRLLRPISLRTPRGVVLAQVL